MAVQSIPTKYSARGQTFDTKAEAEQYDELVGAREALTEAQRRFQRALAENARTADGELFAFDGWGDYYRIFRPLYAMPRLEKVTYGYWSWSVRENGETVEIREERSEPTQHRDRYTPIRELYRSELKAKAALHVAQKDWLAEVAAKIAKGAVDA